jgi:hypothetical protein
LHFLATPQTYWTTIFHDLPWIRLLDRLSPTLQSDLRPVCHEPSGFDSALLVHYSQSSVLLALIEHSKVVNTFRFSSNRAINRLLNRHYVSKRLLITFVNCRRIKESKRAVFPRFSCRKGSKKGRNRHLRIFGRMQHTSESLGGIIPIFIYEECVSEFGPIRQNVV